MVLRSCDKGGSLAGVYMIGFWVKGRWGGEGAIQPVITTILPRITKEGFPAGLEISIVVVGGEVEFHAGLCAVGVPVAREIDHWVAFVGIGT